MPEYLRALIAILFLAGCTLWFLREPLTVAAIHPADYRLRVWLWLGLTAFLFLAHSYWLFMFGAAAALVVAGRRDSNLLGLYFFLLLMSPPLRVSIDGFAGINRFIDFDYLRLLSLAVLLPAAFRAQAAGHAKLFSMPADKFVLGYIGLQIAISLTTSTLTDVMRTAIVLGIDIYLPYYAFSRGLNDEARLRDAIASFVGGGAVIAVIALFETGKGWLLYGSLKSVLQVQWNYGAYMWRDTALRALATTGHSIYLGYVMMAALGLHLALRPAFSAGKKWVGMFCLFTLAVVASFARGPWVGAAAMIAAAVALAPNAKAAYGKAIAIGILLMPVIAFTPMGERIISLLPFVGQADQGSVDYRQQLFTVSMSVLMMNPVFGSPYYMSTGAMESLRTGEGIIDMVNSYLGVALSTGLVGLGLFVGIFLSSAVRIWRQLARSEEKSSEEHVTGRALLATLVGILTTIATVGSDNAVPAVYWSLAGMCAAYVGMPRQQSGEQTYVTARARPPSGAAPS